MRKISRAISAVLAAILVIIAMPAMAAVGDMTIFSQDASDVSLKNFQYFDGKVYIFTYNVDYYIWDRAAGETTEYAFDFELNDMDGGYRDLNAFIASDDGLYALVLSYEMIDSENGSSELDEALLYKLDIAADGSLSFPEEGVELDFDDMIEAYDDYSYVREILYPIITNGYLCFSTYGDNGRLMMAYDIETGDYEMYDELDFESICSYKDGKVLVMVNTYETSETPAIIYTFDPASGEFEELLQIPVTNYQTPGNIAYGVNQDSVYFMRNGEIFRISASGDAEPESVASMPMAGYSQFSSIVTDDGFYISGDYSSVMMRNTDPTQRSATKLTVNTGYTSALEKAYYSFTAAHSDVEVVLSTNFEEITQAMMNKSDAIDIYCLSVQSTDYDALYNRGYLAELTPSRILTDFAGGVYDNFKNVLYKDGELLAIPVELYSDSFSYNFEVLEKLGFTKDDLPTSWMGLFKFLQELPPYLEGHDDISVFDSYYTAGDMKMTFFYSVLQYYILYMQTNPDAEMSFDTELLHNLISELEKIDFMALGFEEEYSEDDMMYSDSESQLFSSYFSSNCSVYSYRSNMKAMPLSIDDGMQPQLMSYLTVAIVNPYSKNRELAIEYLERSIDEMDAQFKTNICPGLSEPILNEYYDENISYYQENIESIKTEIEKADEDTIADWQAQLEEMENYMNDFIENYAYDVSEESIAAYREYAVYLTPIKSFIGDEDQSGEFYNTLQQYSDGLIDADTMLKNINKKLQMMMLENQ